MALDQKIIDEVKRINESLISTADWRSTSDVAKGRLRLETIEQAIALRPSLSSVGGNQGEEIRFDLQTLLEMAKSLKTDLTQLERKTSTNRNGGFRQHQLSNGRERWPAY